MSLVPPSSRNSVATDPLSWQAEAWDVVVIGTGMGGAAIGYRLAMAGLKVLFLEKGLARIDAAALGPGRELPDDPNARLHAGHWPDRIRTVIDGIEADVLLPLGTGVGGSTNLYSAALERLERSDIESLPGLPHPTGGWPVPWEQWLRYYSEAERLLRVRGDTPDPASGDARLLAAPPMSRIDQGFHDLLRANGLTPYRLHVGIGYRPGCTECGGYKCERRCKSDAHTIFIGPALATGHATLIAETDVVRIDADDDRVTSIDIRHEGEIKHVSARCMILAAGAYHSPAILLRSAGPRWPAGLANASGLVGRNLMFHANEWLAAWPKASWTAAGPRKTIGLRDHYVVGGTRLGGIQSTALTASFGNISWFLMERLRKSPARHLPLVDRVVKLAAWIAVRVFGNASIFVMLVEDLGLAENRVVLDEKDDRKIVVAYTVGGELKARARRGRHLLKRSFRGAPTLSLQSGVQLNLGHACGTCRFGDDPDTSVLDASCKAHGIDNLYVVDGSFMPSSGGSNPGLTIAANALRVGDIISARLGLLPNTQIKIELSERDEAWEGHRQPNATDH